MARQEAQRVQREQHIASLLAESSSALGAPLGDDSMSLDGDVAPRDASGVATSPALMEEEDSNDSVAFGTRSRDGSLDKGRRKSRLD